MDNTVGVHYHLKRRIGGGSFGEVYFGEDVQSHEEVAIKLEKTKSRVPQLLYESKIYLLFAGGVNIPRLHWFGTESNYNVMVIDFLGKSLEDLFQLCHQKFELKTVLIIADQCLSALQFVHLKTFIHRDIKPDNFLIGTKQRSNQIFVIDFGLSKRYKDPKTNEHIKYASGKHLTGTARYASINALKGYEQSRRDDLEALGYCLIYFLKGRLPWMGIDAKTRDEKYEKIMEVKSSISPEELCEGLPEEFAQYLNLVRNLRFFDDPDYSGYRALFRNLFVKSGFVYDYEYDWVNLYSKKPKAQQDAANLAEDNKNQDEAVLTADKKNQNVNVTDDNKNQEEILIDHQQPKKSQGEVNKEPKSELKMNSKPYQNQPNFQRSQSRNEGNNQTSEMFGKKTQPPPRGNQQTGGFKTPTPWQRPRNQKKPWGKK